MELGGLIFEGKEDEKKCSCREGDELGTVGHMNDHFRLHRLL